MLLKFWRGYRGFEPKQKLRIKVLRGLLPADYPARPTIPVVIGFLQAQSYTVVDYLSIFLLDFLLG